MVKLDKKLCPFKGCFTSASYGVLGEKRKFCAAHAQRGMVSIGGRRCAREECTKRANYGVAGTNKREFCAGHASPDMVNINNQAGGRRVVSQGRGGAATKRAGGGAGETRGAAKQRPRLPPSPVPASLGRGDSAVAERRAALLRPLVMSDVMMTAAAGAGAGASAGAAGVAAGSGLCEALSCVVHNCTAIPTYRFPGEKKIRFCAAHAVGGTIETKPGPPPPPPPQQQHQLHQLHQLQLQHPPAVTHQPPQQHHQHQPQHQPQHPSPVITHEAPPPQQQPRFPPPPEALPGVVTQQQPLQQQQSRFPRPSVYTHELLIARAPLKKRPRDVVSGGRVSAVRNDVGVYHRRPGLAGPPPPPPTGARQVEPSGQDGQLPQQPGGAGGGGAPSGTGGGSGARPGGGQPGGRPGGEERQPPKLKEPSESSLSSPGREAQDELREGGAALFALQRSTMLPPWPATENPPMLQTSEGWRRWEWRPLATEAPP